MIFYYRFFQMKLYIELFQMTALHAAIEKGNLDIVKFLLSLKNIDINEKAI